MKECSAFLEMRMCKNGALKTSSWKHLIIWGAVPKFSPEHRAPHSWSTLNSLWGRWKSAAAAAHDLTLVEVDNKRPWRVPVCSLYRQVLIFLQTALQGWVKLSGTWPRHGTVKPLTQDISLRVSSFLYTEDINNAQYICLSRIYLPTYVSTCLSICASQVAQW